MTNIAQNSRRQSALSNRLARSVLIIATPLFASVAFAQSSTDKEVCTNKLVTNVYVANGVLTEEEAAGTYVNKVRSAYKGSLEVLRDSKAEYAAEEYEFRLAYNYSQTSITDTAQVLLQKAA